MAIYPTPEQIQKLHDDCDGRPVVMVNLLRYKAKADTDGEDISGEEAYRRYAGQMIPFVESKGGRVIWSGRMTSQVIGEDAGGFHTVALVEYPSRKAFLEAAMDPFVAEIGRHRAEGLEMQWLLATTTEEEGGLRADPPS